MPRGEIAQRHLWKPVEQECGQASRFTVSLQEIQKTKEHVKLHHGDANSKSRLSELYRQMTWSPRQVNFKGKTNINGELAD